ncbi:MAG TPA: hypothetical protein VLK53_10075 [Gaiellaceae bacterium]|nr:hypothetical protein [Gaiellaceae bacterium]
MAIAIRPEFQQPPERDELACLVESIEELLAGYLRRSMLRRESDIPLSMLLHDVRALLDATTR